MRRYFNFKEENIKLFIVDKYTEITRKALNKA